MSAERLITQFEMMTSTELSGSGMCSISPFRNSTLLSPAFCLFSIRQSEHLVRHVETVSLAGRPNPSSRKQNIDTAAGTQIEDNLSRIQFRQCGRIPAPQRSEHGLSRNLIGLRSVIKIGRNGVAT